MVVLIGVWQQMFTFYDVNHFARLMFIIHIVAVAATTWEGYACNIIRPLGSLQTVHSGFFFCWWIETKREKNRNNLSLCWAINLMVNWVRCRCDKYLAHSWGIVQKMRYASFIEIYEGKSHKRKRFSLILQLIFFYIFPPSLSLSVICCVCYHCGEHFFACCCWWATDKNAHITHTLSYQHKPSSEYNQSNAVSRTAFILFTFSVCSAQKTAHILAIMIPHDVWFVLLLYIYMDSFFITHLTTR